MSMRYKFFKIEYVSCGDMFTRYVYGVNVSIVLRTIGLKFCNTLKSVTVIKHLPKGLTIGDIDFYD